MKYSSSTTALPKDFSPGRWDVIISKGKRFYNHKGNQMLRELAATMLQDYLMAKGKLEKSLIISDLLEHIRSNGCFVKRALGASAAGPHSGGWVLAEDLLCREKISASFRDAIQQDRRNGLAKKSQGVASRSSDGLNIVSLEQPERMDSDLPRRPPMTLSLDFGFSSAMEETEKSQTFQQSGTHTHTASWAANDLLSLLSDAIVDWEEELTSDDPFEPKPLAFDV